MFNLFIFAFYNTSEETRNKIFNFHIVAVEFSLIEFVTSDAVGQRFESLILVDFVVVAVVALAPGWMQIQVSVECEFFLDVLWIRLRENEEENDA